jgi:hypothetical protein
MYFSAVLGQQPGMTDPRRFKPAYYGGPSQNSITFRGILNYWCLQPVNYEKFVEFYTSGVKW